MTAKIFMLMYAAHFIGDYYFQLGVIAAKKNISYKFTLLHCLIYTIPHYVALILVGLSMQTFLCVTLVCLTHAIIDFCKTYLNLNRPNIHSCIHILCNGKVIYILDQVAHYIFTFIITYFMIQIMEGQLSFIAMDVNQCWWLLYAIILCQPLYVTYRILVTKHKAISDVYSIKDFIFKMIMLILALCFAYNIWIYIICVSLYLVIIYISSYSTILYIRSCSFVLVFSVIVKTMLDILLLT